MSGEIFVVKRLECFSENKNKIRTLWGVSPSKYENNELHQNFGGSYKNV